MNKILLFFFLLLITSSDLVSEKSSSSTTIPKKSVRILVGSPIHQKPAILKEFLDSLNRFEKDSLVVHYYFVDDNFIEESSTILKKFSDKHPNSCIIDKIIDRNEAPAFTCNEVTHYWKDELLWRVANYKNRMIKHAKEKDYDYLFLIDSDIVLHPLSIKQLIKANKDIISNIFWTTWSPNRSQEPQVWVYDAGTSFKFQTTEKITSEIARKRTLSFYQTLKQPGVYEVGGLGACTLINKNALNKDISFERLKNLNFWGEDRHFCTRACALGLRLFVDTHYPAYHIYRESDLSGVKEFVNNCKLCSPSIRHEPRITLSMIMKNEANRYLRKVLTSAKEYITDAVIIDDASTDNSVEICKEVLKDVSLKIIQNKESKFSNEINLRKQQWEETIKTNPDWILVLDADECFEESFKDEVKKLVKNPDVDAYYFRLYDFWDENHYREDTFWSAHHFYRPFLFRLLPNITYKWNETPQHCGRMPTTIELFSKQYSSLRLKHYGWAREEDRIAKYNRYKNLDPNAIYGIKEQYDSILDKDPTLITWKE